MFNPFSESWKGQTKGVPTSPKPEPIKFHHRTDDESIWPDMNWKVVVGIAFGFWVLYLLSGKS